MTAPRSRRLRGGGPIARWWVVLACVISIAGCDTSGANHPAPSPPATTGLSGPASARHPAVPFLRGVTFGEFGPTALLPAATAPALAHLRERLHVDAVALFDTWMQTNPRSSIIAPGSETPMDSSIEAAIRTARRDGVRVLVVPHVDVIGGSSRTNIAPLDVQAWFASYRVFLLHMADLAARGGADGLVVGTELSGLSSYAGRWRALIRAVRARFHGFLTYDANWDREATRISWWRAVDAISVSAYYPLASTPNPTVAQLVAGWQPWFRQLQQLHQKFSRPVVFGEIGYRTIAANAAAPSNDTLVSPASDLAQANSYEAAFQVWYRVPWFRGFLWWLVPDNPSLLAGRVGGDFVPSPAAKAVLARWYAQAPG